MVAEAWGPGGGAAGGGTSKGCGAGGGGYSAFTTTVTPGQTIYYNVGVGGVGATGNGNNGSNSWVNPASNVQPSSNGCVAATGVGGTGLFGGAGGAGSIGTTNFTGGTGGVGVSPTGGGGGGGAGSAGNGTSSPGTTSGAGGTPDGGAGGAGGLSSANGIVGGSPGGGGGGSWNATGANGGNGQVRLTFTTLVVTATYTKYQDFTEQLHRAKHDFGTHVFKIALTNTAPNVATHRSLSDISEIAAGNGYTGGGVAVAISLSRSGGTTTISATNITITAAGGSIASFRYFVLYNDSMTSPADGLIVYWDCGASQTVANGEALTVNFSPIVFTHT
jgi:hypothetical protein